MNNFTDTEQKGFRAMIKYATWANTFLLGLLLLSAYLKQTPIPMLFVFFLLLTWAIHATQSFKAFTNSKATTLLLETMQALILFIAGISLLMLFIH